MNGIKECECGLTYVVGSPDDEAAHYNRHEEYFLGPDVPEVQSLQSFASRETLRLAFVDGSVDEPIRIAVAKVAMVAHRSMSDYKAGYYGHSSEIDSRLYALVEGTRVVGMVITKREKFLRRFRWTTENCDQICEVDDDFASGPKIARVWIAGAYRRQGLAKWLISEVAKHLDHAVYNLGWEMPFSDSGRALAKSLCSKEFIGCGYPRSL